MRILTLLFVLCAAVSVVSAQPSAAGSAVEVVEISEDADVEAILPATAASAVQVEDEVAVARLAVPAPAPAAPPPIPPPER